MPTFNQTIPSQEYPAGTHIINMFNRNQVHSFEVILTRENWPAEAIITIDVEKRASGNVWVSKAQVTMAGGNLIDEETGQPITTSTFSWNKPNDFIPNRIRMRAVLTHPITTAITMTLIEEP